MKFTDWLAADSYPAIWETSKYGWDVPLGCGTDEAVKKCNLCGAAVVDTELHTEWHRELGR